MQYNSLMSSRIWSNVGWNFKTSPNTRSFSTVYSLMGVCESKCVCEVAIIVVEGEDPWCLVSCVRQVAPTASTIFPVI